MNVRLTGSDDALRALAGGWVRGLSAPGVRLVDSPAGPHPVAGLLAEVGIGPPPPPPAPPGDPLVLDVGTLGVRRGSDLRATRDALRAPVAAWLAARGWQASFGAAVREDFSLEPGAAFLNHGSFGATPRAVLAAQHALQAELERQPVRFMVGLGPRLRAAAARVAAFLGGDPEGTVFVDNATVGVATVLAAHAWHPGDVVVTTAHRYEAVARALEHLAARYGVHVHVVRVPFPVHAPADVVEAVAADWPAGPVKLAVFDHITSATGLVWPVAELVGLAHARGTPVLVDGAHAPGQVPVDLGALGADYWVGNAHKWLFAPKGCAVLHVAAAHREHVHPLAISLRHREGFPTEFDWVGTRDPSAWLAVEAALDFVQAKGGIDRIRAYGIGLRAQAARVVEAGLGLARAAPPEMLACLESRALPARLGLDGEGLSQEIWAEHQVEAMLAPWGDRLWLRLSAQIYNTLDDYRRLVAALR